MGFLNLPQLKSAQKLLLNEGRILINMDLIWQSKVKRKLEQLSGMPDQRWCLVHVLGVSMILNSTHQALQRKKLISVKTS